LIFSKEKYGSVNFWSRVKNTIFGENSSYWIIEDFFCYAANETRKQELQDDVQCEVVLTNVGC
jgi:hypothetical protein